MSDNNHFDLASFALPSIETITVKSGRPYLVVAKQPNGKRLALNFEPHQFFSGSGGPHCAIPAVGFMVRALEDEGADFDTFGVPRNEQGELVYRAKFPVLIHYSARPREEYLEVCNQLQIGQRILNWITKFAKKDGGEVVIKLADITYLLEGFADKFGVTTPPVFKLPGE